MSNFLKKAAIAVIAVTMCVTAFAQQRGDVAIGANFAMSVGNSYTTFGISPKLQYNLFRYIRAEASFTYFPEKDHLSMWDLSLNGHLLVPLGGKIVIYPLAGAGLTDFSQSHINREIILNLGGGVDLPLTDKIDFNVELKHKLGNYWDRTVLSAGIAFKL